MGRKLRIEEGSSETETETEPELAESGNVLPSFTPGSEVMARLSAALNAPADDARWSPDVVGDLRQFAEPTTDKEGKVKCDEVRGVYLGQERVKGKGSQPYSVFALGSLVAGKPVTIRFTGGLVLTRALRGTPEGTLCRVVYTGTTRTPAGYSLKNFKVYFAK